MVAQEQREAGRRHLMNHNPPGLEAAGKYKHASLPEQGRKVTGLNKSEVFYALVSRRHDGARSKTPELPAIPLLNAQRSESFPEILHALEVIVPSDVNEAFGKR